jgi:hypothetical protein
MDIPFHLPGSLPTDAGSRQSLESVYNVRPPDEGLSLAVLDDHAGGRRVDLVLLDQGVVAVEGGFGVKDGKKDGKGDSFFSEQRFDPLLRRNILWVEASRRTFRTRKACSRSFTSLISPDDSDASHRVIILFRHLRKVHPACIGKRLHDLERFILCMSLAFIDGNILNGAIHVNGKLS